MEIITPRRKHRKRQFLARRLKNYAWVVGICTILIFSLGMLITQVKGLSSLNAASSHQLFQSERGQLFKQYRTLKGQMISFIEKEKQNQIVVVDDSVLWNNLESIKIDIITTQYTLARQEIKTFKSKLGTYDSQYQLAYDKKLAQAKAAVPYPPLKAVVAAGVENIPILIYHKTPVDFDHQLAVLKAKNYTTIWMTQLSDHFRYGRPLPPKPAVITFDDGFSDQLRAFSILKKYQMRATFYLITSGEASRWCIGIQRRYGQQPPCGDGYMNWDDTKTLDQSGLIEIGAHTVNHLALAGQSPIVQSFEINESKRVLEQVIEHKVWTFAYPYGSYNMTTIGLVKQAGFTTAVTTINGTGQSLGNIYTLKRVRDTYSLP